MHRLSLFGPFSLTDSSGADLPIASKKAKALLAYLAHTPGKPRSREEILALLWSDREEAQGRASLRQVLTGLRKEVGEDLLRIDRDSVALTADRVEVAPPNGEDFLAGFHLTDPAFEDWLRDERLRLEEQPTELGPQPLPRSEKPAIAVLPFENLSKDPDQAFFSDGITEDIMTELSRFDDMVIISPRATFQFRDQNASTKEIGQKLKANYVVEGSVRQAGNRVRISAKLIEADSESQIWAARFDRDMTDVFEIQDEVARQIAATVPDRVFLHTHHQVKDRRPQTDLTAYQQVLRGSWLNLQNYGDDAARLCFEQAIATDSTYAYAYARLAHWHAYNVYAPLVSFEETRDKVRHFSQLALDGASLDTVGMCFISSSYLLIGDHETSRRYRDQVIQRNPNHHYIMVQAMMNFAWHGESERALRWLARYRNISPIAYAADAEVDFEVLYLAEQYDEAIAAMLFFPGHMGEASVELAAAYAQAGRIKEAEKLRQTFEDTKPVGHTFEAHAKAILRTCAHERERDLWREGYRKAGFM